MEFVHGMTGASGAVYGERLALRLLETGHVVHLVVSDTATMVIHTELGLKRRAFVEKLRENAPEPDRLIVHGASDYSAPFASGSFRHDGMVICPCSMKTLACVANGTAEDLVARGADVALKERYRLVLVPRETPLGLVHLRNMTRATEAGAIVMPASPPMWSNPRTVDEMVDVFVGRVMDRLGAPWGGTPRWPRGGVEEE
jgi:4-hydroxy-3-polyprenylbenzoate decarboxylase